MERVVYTVGEVAAMLGVSRYRVYQLVKECCLPHLRVGRRILIHKNAFHRWLDEATVGSMRKKPFSGPLRRNVATSS